MLWHAALMIIRIFNEDPRCLISILTQILWIILATQMINSDDQLRWSTWMIISNDQRQDLCWWSGVIQICQTVHLTARQLMNEANTIHFDLKSEYTEIHWDSLRSNKRFSLSWWSRWINWIFQFSVNEPACEPGSSSSDSLVDHYNRLIRANAVFPRRQVLIVRRVCHQWLVWWTLDNWESRCGNLDDYEFHSMNFMVWNWHRPLANSSLMIRLSRGS